MRLNKIAGLLLAAGTSSRMGRPKQLLKLGRETLLDRTLKETLSSDLDTLVLVLGHRAKEIKQQIKTDLNHPKLILKENIHYKEGMSRSILEGFSLVKDDHGHLMILLADMPYITSGIINKLIKQYLESGSPLGAISYKNRKSHPVILSSRFYPDILNLQGDKGARNLFEKHRDLICMVKPEDLFCDKDIDTEEDYLAMQKSFK